MNIVIYWVINPGYGYGVAIWIKQVATRLANRGHRIAILTTKYGGSTDPTIKNKLYERGVQVIEFDHYQWPFIIPRISSIIEIAGLVKDVDIVYFINQFVPNEILMYFLKKINNLKIISGIHGSHHELGSFTRRLYHRVIDPIINKQFDAQHVLNKQREEIFRSQGCTNIYRIPNGVDTKKFSPGIKDDIFTIMFTGRLVKEKGVNLLAKVIENFNSESNVDEKFIIFGDGPLNYIVENLKKRFSNVDYYRYANEECMVEAYHKSHVFLLPSYVEEFPLTVLEAQAAGVPVVGNNIPGLKEMVLSGVTGVLVNVNILEEIISAVSYFKDLWYNKREDYHRYSLNARTNSLKYDWEIVINQLENMLSTVAKDK